MWSRAVQSRKRSWSWNGLYEVVKDWDGLANQTAIRPSRYIPLVTEMGAMLS